MHRMRQPLAVLVSCTCHQQALVTAAAAEAAGAAAASASSISIYRLALNLGLRTLSSSSAIYQAYGHEEIPDKGDSYYWVPPAEEQQSFTFDRRSIADRRATGRLESALESVLLADGNLREQLVFKYGFSIHRVQLSKDRRTVFILWDASPGKAQACERALEKTAFRLRRDLAKVLASKFTPRLEFRHDHLPPMQAEAAAAMERAEQELAEAAAAATKKPGRQSTTATAGAASGADDDIEQEYVGMAPADGLRSQGSVISSSSSSSSTSSSGGGSGSSDGGASSSSGQGGEGAAVDSAGSAFAQDDIDAAIARLEAITRPTRPGW